MIDRTLGSSAGQGCWRGGLAPVMLVALLFALLPLFAAAQGTPETAATGDVPLLGGNPGRTGQQPGPGPAGPPTERWRFATGDTVWGSPALAGGIAYVGSWDGTLYAIDAATGTEVWRYEVGPAISVTPAIVSGVVFFGVGSSIYALDAATGAERWVVPIENGSLIEVSPAVVDGAIYAVAGGSLAKELYALDAATGVERWRAALCLPGAETCQGGDTIAVTDGLLFIVSGSAMGAQDLVAFEAATGAERWRAPVYSAMSFVPVAVGGTVFLPDGAAAGNVTAYDAATGAVRWQVAVDGWLTGFAVSDGIVYAGCRRTDASCLYALDAASGTQLWAVGVGGPRLEGSLYNGAAPVVAEGTIYMPGIDGQVYALDAANGAERWHVATGFTGIVSAAVVTGGVIYVGGGPAGGPGSGPGALVAMG